PVSRVGTALPRSGLSKMAPAACGKSGRTAASGLDGTPRPIQPPPSDQIPGRGQVSRPAGTNATRWVIPNTEIALERAQSGPRQGEFLFTPETVAKADQFYGRVRGSAYTRPVPLQNLSEIIIHGGGWLVPQRWIQALPALLRAPLV